MKFKVGDRVIGIEADIIDCEGIIEKINEEGYSTIRFTKLGKKTWQKEDREYKIGELSRCCK